MSGNSVHTVSAGQTWDRGQRPAQEEGTNGGRLSSPLARKARTRKNWAGSPGPLAGYGTWAVAGLSFHSGFPLWVRGEQ